MDLWQKAGLEPAGATFGEAKAMAAAIRIQGIRTLCSTKGPIKSNIPAGAGIFMRTDYYVVSPNSRACTYVHAGLQRVRMCARA